MNWVKYQVNKAGNGERDLERADVADVLWGVYETPLSHDLFQHKPVAANIYGFHSNGLRIPTKGDVVGINDGGTLDKVQEERRKNVTSSCEEVVANHSFTTDGVPSLQNGFDFLLRALETSSKDENDLAYRNKPRLFALGKEPVILSPSTITSMGFVMNNHGCNLKLRYVVPVTNRGSSASFVTHSMNLRIGNSDTEWPSIEKGLQECLKFALSGYSFSFDNLWWVEFNVAKVCTCEQAKSYIESALLSGMIGKGIYANPVICVRNAEGCDGEAILLRDQGDKTRVLVSPYVDEGGCVATDKLLSDLYGRPRFKATSGYYADMIVRAYQRYTNFGNTVEETFRLALEDVEKEKNPGLLSKDEIAELVGGFNSEDTGAEDTGAEAFDDTTVSDFEGTDTEAFDNAAASDFEDTETETAGESDGAAFNDFDSDEELDRQQEELRQKALYNTRVKEIMDLYTKMYRNIKGKTSYKYVAVPRSKGFSLIKYTPKPKNGGSKLSLGNSTTTKVNEDAFNKFILHLPNVWEEFAKRDDVVSRQPLKLSSSAPPTDSRDNVEWLRAVIDNKRVSVSWFPFIHLALMRHVRPWDFLKENPRQQKWDDLAPDIEDWLLSLFKEWGKMVDEDEDLLDLFQASFMRHFVVSEVPYMFNFSVYWGEKVRLDEFTLKSALGIQTSADENDLNIFVSVVQDVKHPGVHNIKYVPKMDSYLSDVVFGYETYLDMLNLPGSLKQDRNVKLLPEKLPMGFYSDGSLATIDLRANNNSSVFPAVIRAGGRSGKGVLTQLLMVNMLGTGTPFIYFDAKPEMSRTWCNYGKTRGMKVLAADTNQAQWDSYLPDEARDGAPLNPCADFVMRQAYTTLFGAVYAGKLAGLVKCFVNARTNNRLPGSDYPVYIFVDELITMGKNLKNARKGLGGSSITILRSEYAVAKKAAETDYKREGGKGPLPLDRKISLRGQEFTVKELDAVLGGKILENKLDSMICEIGNTLNTMVTTGPMAHVCSVLIGQCESFNKDDDSQEKSLTGATSAMFKSGGKMSMFGREWKQIKSEIPEPARTQLTEDKEGEIANKHLGNFMFRPDARSSYRAIKTGVVLGQNDVALVSFDEENGCWSGGSGDDSVRNVLENVRTGDPELAHRIYNERLVLNAEMAEMLTNLGMPRAAGDPNPLITFEGLMDFVSALLGVNTADIVNRLYDDLSYILRVSGSGYSDVYSYLADVSVMYTGTDLLNAMGGKPLYHVEGDTETGGADGDGFNPDIAAEYGAGSHRKPVAEKTTKPVTPMPGAIHPMPKREVPTPETPITVVPHAMSPMPKRETTTYESPSEDAGESMDAYVEEPTETYAEEPTETYAEEPTETYAGEGVGESTDAYAEEPTETYAEESTDVDAGEPTATKTAPERSKRPAPEPRPVRPTPAPRPVRPVYGPVTPRSGARERVSPGSGNIYTQNPDGSTTLNINGGRVKGIFTTAAALDELSANYNTWGNLCRFGAPGRKFVALQSMLRLVEMMERQTNLNRAAMKMVTFSDNCIWVRDACVIGGQPDGNDLYDAIDIRYFLKALRNISVLKMDRDAYYNLIIRAGYEAKDVFKFSPSLSTFEFDTCALLRDGRIVGENAYAARDSYLASFGSVVYNNSVPTSSSKLWSASALNNFERSLTYRGTPEYQAKRLQLAKFARDMYGDKIKSSIEKGDVSAGLFARVRMWMLDRQVAKLESML